MKNVFCDAALPLLFPEDRSRNVDKAGDAAVTQALKRRMAALEQGR